MFLTNNFWICFKVFMTSSVMAFQQLIVGSTIGFSAILLAQLHLPGSHFTVNYDEASWIASLSILPCPVGSLICGYLTDKIGRKHALQLAYIPLLVSTVILYNAETVTAVYVGRIFAGLSVGTGAPTYAYIAETSPTKWRPLFLSLLAFYVGLGMTLSAALGVFFHWQTVSGIFAVLSLVGFALPFAIPETPAYLRSRGWEQEARLSEQWFGFVLPSNREEQQSANDDRKDAVPLWKQMTQPTVWKPTLVALLFFVCQQSCGFYVVVFYSVDVLKDCRVPIDGMTANVFLSAARTMGSVFNLLLQTMPKKTLTVISGLGMFTMLSAITVYLHVFEDTDDPPFAGLLIYAFLFYVFFAMFSVLPLPWSLCSEIFPMSVKGTMSGLLYSVGYELMFVAIKIYPAMVSALGIEWVWTIFNGFCITIVLFGAFVLPETTGKSLDQILEKFEHRPRLDTNRKQREIP
ncbi:facilitated trehalose transporter Tret1-like [Adelges cooleyi]|uniref:facilitated trehalose transporter Tret1-like n=1 Tax=Adelges cooleyi TaxID=133065 RepID=UPI00217F2575|nr:facilitated trehalose transporter Tret1-like [Adelges cooleyi]